MEHNGTVIISIAEYEALKKFQENVLAGKNVVFKRYNAWNSYAQYAFEFYTESDALVDAQKVNQQLMNTIEKERKDYQQEKTEYANKQFYMRIKRMSIWQFLKQRIKQRNK